MSEQLRLGMHMHMHGGAAPLDQARLGLSLAGTRLGLGSLLQGGSTAAAGAENNPGCSASSLAA